MASFTHGVLALIVGIVFVGIIKILRSFLTVYVSPLRQLRGPPRKSFLYGNMLQIGPEHLELNRQWVKTYGTNFCGGGLFSVSPIVTIESTIERGHYLNSLRM